MFKNTFKTILLSMLSLFLILGGIALPVSAEETEVTGYQNTDYAKRTVLYLPNPEAEGHYVTTNPIKTPDGRAIYCVDPEWYTEYLRPGDSPSGVLLQDLGSSGAVRRDIYNALESGYIYYPNSKGINDGLDFFNEVKSRIESSVSDVYGYYVPLTVEDFQAASAFALHIIGGEYSFNDLFNSADSLTYDSVLAYNPSIEDLGPENFNALKTEMLSLINLIVETFNQNASTQQANTKAWQALESFSVPQVLSNVSFELPSRISSSSISLNGTGRLGLVQNSTNIINILEASGGNPSSISFDVSEIFPASSGISSATLSFGSVSIDAINSINSLLCESPILALNVNSSVYNNWIKSQESMPVSSSPEITLYDFSYIHPGAFFTQNGIYQDMFLTDARYVTARLMGYTVQNYSSEVKIRKLDNVKPTPNPVAGVEINLFKNGAAVTKNFYGDDLTLVTDSDGYITLNDLEPGTYTYKEVASSAPTGYIPSSETYTFVINEDGTVDVNNSQLEFVNKITKIVLTKTDLVDGTPVPGATIKITGKNVSYEEEFTTDNEGKITIEKLAPGTYEFKETIAPNGYILNEETATFTIAADGNVSGKTTLTNAPKPSVTINKKVLGSNDALPGAKFEVTFPYQVKCPDTNLLSNKCIYSTNAQGVISLDNLDKGTFSFKEIEAPAGYILVEGSEPSGTFTVSATGVVSQEVFNFTNAKKPDVTLTKTNLGGTPLPGAKLKVTNVNTKEVLYDEVSETGQFTLNNVAPGTYLFEETVAPEGYILSSDKIQFTVDNSGKVTLPADGVLKNGPKPDVTFKKIALKDGGTINIEGVEFSLYKADAPTVVIDSKTSDATGTIKFEKLDEGAYFIKETNSPKTLKTLSEEIARFSVDNKGNITGLSETTVSNEFITYEISKSDLSTSEPVPGAKLSIYVKATDELVYEEVTNVSGKLNIPEGLLERNTEYYFVETDAPDGYILNPEHHNFTVDATGEISGKDSLTNELNSIKIKKVDSVATTTGIADVEFKLLNSNQEEVTKNALGKTLVLKTDSNGEIHIDALKPDVYTLIETKAANGYKLDATKTITLTVEDGKQIVASALTLPNEATEVVLEKEDSATKAKVPGVTVKLYAENGVEVTTNALGQDLNLVTNSEGKLVFKYLPVGKYTYKEVAVPKGYSINKNVFAFEIKADGTVIGTLKFDNTKTHVVISKSDFTTSAPVEGATIEIIDNNGDVVFSQVTDSSGKLNIPDGTLSIGKYKFRETIAPEGYILNQEEIEFEILEDGSISGTTEMKNKKTEVEILKTDALTEKPVKGALIELYDEDKNIVTKYTDSFYTDEEGKVKFIGLPVGKYSYREIQAPSGYLVNPEVYTFEVDKYGKVTGTLQFVDMPTSLVITKVNDKTDKPVEGAEYTFFQGGVEYGKFVTNKDGQIIIDNIPTGSYTYYETKAPVGYALDSNVYSFTVSSNGDKTGTFKVRDKETGMTLYKKDYTTGKALQGAKFEIYDSSKKLVASAETNAEGVFQIQALEPGSYTIKEVVAPSGYVITDKEYGFTIKADGTVEGDLTVYNKLSGGQPVPTPSNNTPVNTGSGNMVWLYVSALSIALVSLLVVLNRRKRLSK